MVLGWKPTFWNVASQHTKGISALGICISKVSVLQKHIVSGFTHFCGFALILVFSLVPLYEDFS